MDAVMVQCFAIQTIPEATAKKYRASAAIRWKRANSMAVELSTSLPWLHAGYACYHPQREVFD